MAMKPLVLLALVAALSGCGGSSSTLAASSPEPAPRPAATPLLPTGPAVPDPGATLAVEPGQSVVLHHCGVANIAYEGEEWEVENEPFDATNAPDSFSGFGSFRREGEALIYTDDKGASLTFTLWDGAGDPGVCA